jgi:hypothetical protein
METKVLGCWPDYLHETTQREQMARDAREGKAQILTSEACWRMAEHLASFEKWRQIQVKAVVDYWRYWLDAAKSAFHRVRFGLRIESVARPLMHDGAVFSPWMVHVQHLCAEFAKKWRNVIFDFADVKNQIDDQDDNQSITRASSTHYWQIVLCDNGDISFAASLYRVANRMQSRLDLSAIGWLYQIGNASCISACRWNWPVVRDSLSICAISFFITHCSFPTSLCSASSAICCMEGNVCRLLFKSTCAYGDMETKTLIAIGCTSTQFNLSSAQECRPP